MYGEIAYILVPLGEEDKAKLGNQPLDNAHKAQQITVQTKDRRSIHAQLAANPALKAGTYHYRWVAECQRRQLCQSG